MTFIQATNYTVANRHRIDLVVLHSMESQEKPGTARGVAAWFASSAAPQASAHYCLDAGEVVQCVHEHDIAWAAPGSNHNGIHIEHAGRADQNACQWADDFSSAMLVRSIELCAEICRRWNIPPAMLGPSALIERARGITTHAAVTKAFRKSTHTDPGPHFPLEYYCSRVAAKLKGIG